MRIPNIAQTIDMGRILLTLRDFCKSAVVEAKESEPEPEPEMTQVIKEPKPWRAPVARMY